MAALGIVVYQVATLFHEGLGHGGTCILVGGRPVAISSAWFDGDETGVSAWGVRAVKAGGTVMNLVLGWSAALLLGPARRRADAHLYYFVWLTAAVNTLVGGGYLLVSPLGRFGDWHEFIQGLSAPWLWRIGLTALGFALSYAGLVVASRAIEPLAGAGSDRWRRIRVLCWTPYFAGAAVSLLAALRDPGGARFLVTSVLGADLGGTAWLAWWLPFRVREPRPGTPAETLALRRSWGWIVAGVLTAAVVIAVLGPSLRWAGPTGSTPGEVPTSP